jgi:squalene synthase HpnD
MNRAISAGEPETGTAAKQASGSSFYAAMRIMPRKQREAMFEIYSFCRLVDDIADDPGAANTRLQRLDQWRTDIDALYNGEPPEHLAGLAMAVSKFELQRADFLAVIDGMQMDVAGNIRAPSFDTLDLYCDRVASAVGRLSVRVFGLEEEDGIQLAHHLGRALQLTNILRDLDEDAGIDRLYLPREALAEAGIKSADPAEVLANPALPQACAIVVKRAREHFAEAGAIMRKYPARIVRTPRVMSAAYKAILNALVARGWAAPRTRVRLSRMRMLWVLLRYAVI